MWSLQFLGPVVELLQGPLGRPVETPGLTWHPCSRRLRSHWAVTMLDPGTHAPLGGFSFIDPSRSPECMKTRHQEARVIGRDH